MKKIQDMMAKAQFKVFCAVQNFKNSERGDTNFISMLIIIGIVVVLAGLFLTMGKNVMTSISLKIKEFIDGL